MGKNLIIAAAMAMTLALGLGTKTARAQSVAGAQKTATTTCDAPHVDVSENNAALAHESGKILACLGRTLHVWSRCSGEGPVTATGPEGLTSSWDAPRPSAAGLIRGAVDVRVPAVEGNLSITLSTGQTWTFTVAFAGKDQCLSLSEAAEAVTAAKTAEAAAAKAEGEAAKALLSASEAVAAAKDLTARHASVTLGAVPVLSSGFEAVAGGSWVLPFENISFRIGGMFSSRQFELPVTVNGPAPSIKAPELNSRLTSRNFDVVATGGIDFFFSRWLSLNLTLGLGGGLLHQEEGSFSDEGVTYFQEGNYVTYPLVRGLVGMGLWPHPSFGVEVGYLGTMRFNVPAAAGGGLLENEDTHGLGVFVDMRVF